MIILPIDPVANASPEALGGFLAQCREAARKDGHGKLVSISLKVDALDPLAVLESIFEPGQPHFYAERPDLESALAGAEPTVACQARGSRRLETIALWREETLAHTIAVGEVGAPFGGPHFFTALSFLDEVEAGEPFPAAHSFVPRWQVARAGAVTTAVANLWVTPEAELAPLGERLWRAHAKFGRFRYSEPELGGEEERVEFTTREAGDYRAAVARALGHIAAGDFEKIVLARAIDLEATRPLHPLHVLNRLRQRFPDCYSFSLANGRGQSFIGASPERLVRVSKGVLQTEALAGSTRRGRSASEDAALASALLGDDKERREHAAVREMIVGGLRELGLQPRFSPEPQVRKLANVQHLRTPIEADLRGEDGLLAALARLHPTPAVGGSPRAAAVERIRGLEGFPRGLYAGAIGWMNSRGGGEFFVGLRSALVDGARARAFAGAGIVAGSTPEKEFAETELKFKAVFDALRS